MEASGSDSGGNPEQDLGPDPPIEPNPGQDVEMEQEEEAYPEEEVKFLSRKILKLNNFRIICLF